MRSRIATIAVMLLVSAMFFAIEAPLKPMSGNQAWKGLVVAGLFVALAIPYQFALFSRVRVLRWAAVVWLWLSLAVDLGFYRITGHRFLFGDALNIVTNLDSAHDGVATYGSLFVPGLLVLLPVVAIVTRVVTSRVVQFHPWMSTTLLPPAAALVALVWWTAGNVATFPSPFRIPVLLAYVASDYETGPRRPPSILPGVEPRMPHVVLVVDESIAAAHLSINGYPRPTTPYLDSLGPSMLSLGIASSATNASLGSQLVLFGGITPDELPASDMFYLRTPSIAQYALQAGYHFRHFDAQDYQRLAMSVLEDCAPDSCDYVHSPEDVERWERDLWIAEQIPGHIAKHERSFTYVTKAGAHFPYERGYPPTARRFEPAMRGTDWSDDRLLNNNSYDNTVSWTVDVFFQKLTEGLDAVDADVVVIYTSDHGQLLPGSVPGLRMTHGMPSLPSGSAAVPLLLWGSGSGRDLVQELAANPTLLDNSSHYDIFPTILQMIGYAPADVEPAMGPGLYGTYPPDRRRVYLAGLIQNRHRAEMRTFDLDEVSRITAEELEREFR